MARQRKITSTEVARKAGLSRATVSYVLNRRLVAPLTQRNRRTRRCGSVLRLGGQLLVLAGVLIAGCDSAAPRAETVNRGKGSLRVGAEPSRTTYLESFDNGCGGWLTDRRGNRPLAVWDGVVYCYGPWWIDYWHAPPGAGYLHLLMWIHTDARRLVAYYAGYPGNRFVEQNKSTDLVNAKLTVRLRGQMDMQGSQLLLLVQTEQRDGMRPNYVLTGQPFEITPQWSEQTVTLVPDPEQWTCLGQRHDRRKYGCEYGCSNIADVLQDVNVDMIFVLFPLRVVPVEKKVTDPHRTLAGEDYPVKQEYLPKGLVMFDWVRIEYAGK